MNEPPLRGGNAPVITPPPVVANPVRIPTSLWFWLAILVLSFAIPSLTNKQGRGTKIVQEEGITVASLQQMQTAELQTRLALLPREIRQLVTQQTKEEPAYVAARTFREIAIQKKGVLSARKVIVLNHLRGKEFDDAFLTGVLARDLAAQKVDAGEISSELALWRALYSKEATQLFNKRDMDAIVARVKTLRLGILQEQVVADVYTLAGRKADAKRKRAVLEEKAIRDMTGVAGRSIAIGFALIVGVILLVIALIAASSRKWSLLKAVPDPESYHGNRKARPTFGGLLDVFVAYLAIYRGTGLLVGTVHLFDRISTVPLMASVYVGTAALAAVYLWYRARTEGWKLADIGLRSPGGLVPDIFYGIGGYCAALPLVAACSVLNGALFKRNESSLAPNPILPMIAGEGNEVGQFILFCLVAVAAPIFEELFFRGVLYSALKTRFNTTACILISGACFAIVHPMSDWLPIFALGCVLASVRELRQGLVPGMVLHFCQNAMTFLMMRSMFG